MKPPVGGAGPLHMSCHRISRAGMGHRQPRWYSTVTQRFPAKPAGKYSAPSTASCGLSFLEAGFPAWGLSFGHSWAYQDCRKGGDRDRGPGVRGSAVPEAPALNLLIFLVCIHRTSLSLPRSTVPTVGLSQVALKTEVAVTYMSVSGTWGTGLRGA